MRTEGNPGQALDSVRSNMQRNAVNDDRRATDAQRAPSLHDAAGATRPSKQAVRDFKALMQRGAKGAPPAKGDAAPVAARQPARGQAADAAHGDGFQRDFDLARHAPDWIPHVDAQPMQAQPAPQVPGAPPPAAAPPAAAPALAELIEKHVRQMLVSETVASARGGDVLLRMSDAALPGTDIWLRRTEHGWKVRAEARSRDSYEAIVGGSAQLVRRFAEHGLGELDVEPVYQEG